MLRVGIIGLSGYSGGVALEILLKHPQVRVTYTGAQNTTGKVSDIWPRLLGQTELVCEKINLNKLTKACDLVFLAVPHTTSMAITPKLLEAGKKAIDLSADYRLKNPKQYKQWYQVSHTDKKNLKKSIYGLPELYRADIKKASLIANPGCYPTAAILALAPLVSTMTKNVESMTIDAKSGVSGAGRKVLESLMFAETNENFKAYRVLQHQHTPEIELYLSRLANKEISTTFVPHLLPINRGILETIYVRFTKKITLQHIHRLYNRFYKTEPFIRILKANNQPELKNVVGTNYCDIGLALSAEGRTLVVTATIDNLVKGAAGQAVQNMNIMYGFEETEGLI